MVILKFESLISRDDDKIVYKRREDIQFQDVKDGKVYEYRTPASGNPSTPSSGRSRLPRRFPARPERLRDQDSICEVNKYLERQAKEQTDLS